MAKWLEKQWNTWHVTLKVPKDVQPHIGKTKWYETLRTDSLEEANIKKHKYVSLWKALIKEAREKGSNLNLEETIKKYSLYWKKDDLSSDPQASWFHESTIADALTDKGFDPSEVSEAINRVTERWINTVDHIEEFLPHAQYTLKNEDEARASLKLFAQKFPVFQKITKAEFRAWVKELLEERSRPTIKKKVGHIRNYWMWCEEEKGLDVPHSIIHEPFPKLRKTKKTITASMQAKRLPFAVEDYFNFLNAIREKDDQVLLDLVMIAAHTGMRREEICRMNLSQVESDRFKIEDAKTESGWRDIPIHSDIQQLVERLKQSSNDGYLMSGLTSDKYGDRGSAVGKKFLRLRSKLGFGRQHVLHSFRKTLATLMLNNGVPESQAAVIIGHDNDGITYGLYAGDIPFATKKKIMDGFSYIA